MSSAAKTVRNYNETPRLNALRGLLIPRKSDTVRDKVTALCCQSTKVLDLEAHPGDSLISSAEYCFINDNGKNGQDYKDNGKGKTNQSYGYGSSYRACTFHKTPPFQIYRYYTV